MKKFGFGKEKGQAAEDPNRNALFGSRKKGGDEKGANPYAQQNVNDAYTQPPPAYSGGGPGLSDSDRMRKSAVPPGGYGSGPAPARYGPPGSQNPGSGYGQSNPYSQSQQQPAGARYGQRTGGYGGMGGPPNPQDDASRAALFGDAAQRKAQNGYGSGSAYGGDGGSQGYGEAREPLSAEDQEEEDIANTKNEIRAIKQQDVGSTRNALRIAAMAEETGRQTLQRLGQQGERIHNTERNLDLSSIQNRRAEEKARELKTLNRSMFAVHVGNPFMKESRMRERDQQILENNKRDREAREGTRSAAYSSQARAAERDRQLNQPNKQSFGQKSLADRSRFQFEQDSEDEQLEDEIDDNLEALHGAAGRLKNLSLAMGEEVNSQNKHIERIIKKTDKVDDEIAVNRGRLDRIR